MPVAHSLNLSHFVAHKI